MLSIIFQQPHRNSSRKYGSSACAGDAGNSANGNGWGETEKHPAKKLIPECRQLQKTLSNWSAWSDDNFGIEIIKSPRRTLTGETLIYIAAKQTNIVLLHVFQRTVQDSST